MSQILVSQVSEQAQRAGLAAHLLAGAGAPWDRSSISTAVGMTRPLYAVDTPPEPGICKECDLRVLCHAEGVVTGST